MWRISRGWLIFRKEGAGCLGHSHPAAIGTHPGGAVGDPPLIFLEAGIADLKTAGAVPAKRQFFPAAVAFELFFPPAALGIWFVVLCLLHNLLQLFKI